MATEPAIGTRIKRARERKRWSQQRLADELKVNRKTIDNWENGRTEPRSSIGALEEVLGISLSDEPGQDQMPTAQDLNDLREHIREVLPAGRADQWIAALDAEYGTDPVKRGEAAASAPTGRPS